MLINLQVISSAKIQTRRPKKRIAWMGKEKENLMLLRSNSLKKLNPNNGRSKRILNNFLKDCVVCNNSRNGEYLIGLLTNGNIFIWYKDTEKSVVISSNNIDLELAKCKGRLGIYGNDTASRFVLIKYDELGVTIFICERDNFVTLSELSVANGKWLKLEPNALQVSKCQSLVWDLSFVSATSCCHFSERIFSAFVYSSYGDIHVVVVYISFNKLHENAGFLPAYQWKNITLPGRILEKSAEVGHDLRKSFVLRWSNDGTILAVAVNLKSTLRDYVVFFSQSLKNVEIIILPEEFSVKRHHQWICDMSWFYNDLYLVLINRLGSICLMSKLGEALTIATHGCSMDLPPARFLNIHPLVTVRCTAKDETDSVTLSNDLLHQIFSVSCHPRSSHFLCSDGYMLTCLYILTPAASPYSFVGLYLKYVAKLRRRLKKISAICDIEPEFCSLFDQLRDKDLIPKGIKPGRRAIGRMSKPHVNLSEFSSGESEDESSLDPLFNRSSQVGNYDSGTIIMGSYLSRQRKQSPTSILTEYKKIIRFSFSVWGILLTTTTEWTLEWEKRAIVLSRLFVNIMEDLISQIETQSQLNKVLRVIDNWLNLCRFSCNINVMVTVMKTFANIFQKIIKKPVPKCRTECVEKYTRLLILGEEALVFNEPKFSNIWESEMNMNCLSTRSKPLWYKLRKSFRDFNVTDENLRHLIWNRSSSPSRTNSSIFISDCQVLFKYPGKWQTAVQNWKSIAASLTTNCSNTYKFSRQLHAILYILLSNYKAEETILYIFWILTQTTINGIQIKTLKRTLHSFAVFLCDYVTGNELATYPFHHARHLPSKSKYRTIKLDHHILFKSIDKHPTIVKHWSANVAMSLLLHLGDLDRACKLSEDLGEWKSAVVLKYTQFLLTDREDCAKYIEHLLVDRAVDRINGCPKDFKQNQPFLTDIFITSALCDLQVTEIVLKKLLNNLVEAVFVPELPVIVPEAIHLPRPPFYCPQLELLDEDDGDDEIALLAEEKLCRNVSTIIQNIIEIFKVTNCHISSALSYLTFLGKAVNMAMEVKNVRNYIWPLEETVIKLKDIPISTDNEILGRIFRDLCAISFFLHARDKLNMSLRRIRNCNEIRYQSRLKAKDKACLDALSWATNLVSFNTLTGWEKENELDQIIISTTLEAPIDRRTTLFVAKNFSNISTVSRSLLIRLQPLINKWEKTVIRVGSDRFHPDRKSRKRLSAIHVEQCQEVAETKNKLAAKLSQFDESVSFEETSGEWRVRPFEIDEDYSQFLKIFLDILLLRDLHVTDDNENKNADNSLVRKNKQNIYTRYCIFDALPSFQDPQSITFFDRLKQDSSQLQTLIDSCDKASSHRKRETTSSGLFQRSLHHNLNNLSGKALVTSRSCLQYLSEITLCNNDINSNEDQVTRRILLWLLKWAKKDKQILIDNKVKFHINLSQIYGVLQHKIELTTEQAVEKQLAQNEIECTSNIELEDVELTGEESVESQISKVSTAENQISSIGLDWHSLNCESDCETLSSLSEWTLRYDSSKQSQDNVKQSESLFRIVSPSMNVSTGETDVSRTVGLDSLVVNGIGATGDDVSTSDELGETDLNGNNESANKQLILMKLNVMETKNSFSENSNIISSSIPMLLKLNDEPKSKPDHHTPFLSLNDIDQLNSKFQRFEELVKKPDLLHFKEYDAQHEIESTVPPKASKGVQIKPQPVRDACTLTCANMTGVTFRKKSEASSQVTRDNEYPHFQVLTIQPKVESKSSFTQTDEVQGLILGKLDETECLHLEVHTSIMNSDVHQENVTGSMANADTSSSRTSVTLPDKETLLVDIAKLKRRLNELQNEGLLNESNSAAESFNIDGIRKSVTFSGCNPHKLIDTGKDRKVVQHDNFTAVPYVDSASKLRHQKRKKLQEKHFELRKDDALKLVSEILMDQKNMPKTTNFSSNTVNGDMESLSSDTLSSWIVPHDVKKILSKEYLDQKKFVDLADEFSDGSTSDDSVLQELEDDKLFKIA
ncbi:hypothetical protein CHUAL_004829 [Chamberlinius hualienensis]